MVSANTEDPTRNVNRRGMIAGMLTLPVAGQAMAEIDLFEQVRRDADALAASMIALHGGHFRIAIDHDAKTAAICSLV